jgi:DnaJ like chaperone protein
MGYVFDYKYYKWAALIPGWLLGDFIGAIASFLLVREMMMGKEGEITYELALLKISSLLIKADGSVDSNEINLVQSYFKNTFGSSKSNKLFKELKNRKDIPADVNSLSEIIKKRINPAKYYAIIQFLYGLSAVDGVISKSEEEFIFNIGYTFGFTPSRLEAIKNQFIKTKSRSKKYDQKTMQSLGVLGLKGGVSTQEIKSAYRTLAKEYHPDKLAGMSDGIKNLAKEKFQLIQESYEYLNKNYE